MGEKSKVFVAEVKTENIETDDEKVKKIITKFFKACDKQEATMFEVARAIASIQQFVLEETGMLGISEAAMDIIKKGLV